MDAREVASVTEVEDGAELAPGVVVAECRQFTPTEEFLFGWALDLRKKSLERTLDALHRLAALDVTLLGGSVAFLKEDVMSAGWRAAAMAALLVSLAAALYGSSVLTFTLNPYDTEGTSRMTASTTALRTRWLRLGMLVLWAGLALAVVGVGVGPPSKPPPIPAAHSRRPLTARFRNPSKRTTTPPRWSLTTDA